MPTAVCALQALAASLVPAMQKGNSTARTMHIGLNCINLGLFAWQASADFESLAQVTGEVKCRSWSLNAQVFRSVAAGAHWH